MHNCEVNKDMAKGCSLTGIFKLLAGKPKPGADDRRGVRPDEAFIQSRDFIHDGLKPYYCSLVRKLEEAGLADEHFIRELTSGDEGKFWQRIWEAILAAHLAELGHKPTSKDEGPDLVFDHNGSKICIEAICPNPKDIPQEYTSKPTTSEVRVTSMPAQTLALNWTAALREKMQKLEGRTNSDQKYFPGYVAKGIVTSDQPYVVAVNSSLWGYAETGLSQFPYSAEVGFGIGPIAVPVDSQTGRFGDARHTSVFSIKNRNQANVSTSVFLTEEYKGVSAVLSTGFLCPQPDFYPLTLVHNPLARAPLPQGILGAKEEYVSRVEGDYMEITRVR